MKPVAFRLTMKAATIEPLICMARGFWTFIVLVIEPLVALSAVRESLLNDVPAGPSERKNEEPKVNLNIGLGVATISAKGFVLGTIAMSENPRMLFI